MKGVANTCIRLLTSISLAMSGCLGLRSEPTVHQHVDRTFYDDVATHIEYPNTQVLEDFGTASTPPPMTLSEDSMPAYRDITLQEAVHLTLATSKVFRDLGGLLLRSPDVVLTTKDPAIQESDPRFGVEAALSAFDASFAASTFFENNDRALNNQFFGGGTRILQQDAVVVQAQLTKRAATGTEFTLRKDTEFDSNNAPGNAFPSAYTVLLDGEFRHPVLEGGGVEFNRIAGPSQDPGVYNGVVIARLNNDISLTEFEIGVRDLVSNVENAYWDLYFAYRVLDAKIKARDAALETWRSIHALYLAGRRGGEAEKEAQAREQYYRFQEEVQNALNGRLLEGTRTYNGSSGGSFRGTAGVYVAERRLRLLMGLPINGDDLLRTIDEPLRAAVVFEWNEVLTEALYRRVELRRQKWLIKRREKELIASRNFLLPQLDAIGRYRFRGFGTKYMDPSNANPFTFDDAIGNLVHGDFQEWQMGFEFSFPFGYRRAHTAVQNAELLLARDKAILAEQERAVVVDLSNSIGDAHRAFLVTQTNYNRRLAAEQHLAAVQAAYEVDNAPLDLVLEAQRRLADADTKFYQTLVEYALSVKNVHYEKGSLLEYSDVYLSEGLWPDKAYRDAQRRKDYRYTPFLLDFFVHGSDVVSEGLHPQIVAPAYVSDDVVIEDDVESDVPPAALPPMPPMTRDENGSYEFDSGTSSPVSYQEFDFGELDLVRPAWLDQENPIEDSASDNPYEAAPVVVDPRSAGFDMDRGASRSPEMRPRRDNEDHDLQFFEFDSGDATLIPIPQATE